MVCGQKAGEYSSGERTGGEEMKTGLAPIKQRRLRNSGGSREVFCRCYSTSVGAEKNRSVQERQEQHEGMGRQKTPYKGVCVWSIIR